MIHPRVILVHAEVVATWRGVSREMVYDLVDGGGDEMGSLLWVFNVCASLGRERELRFWARELREPQAVKDFSLDEVIRQIVPRREAVPGQFCGLPNWQVRDLLRVSRRTLLDLRGELGTVQHQGGLYVPRATLENFFRRRWCFNQPAHRASEPVGRGTGRGCILTSGGCPVRFNYNVRGQVYELATRQTATIFTNRAEAAAQAAKASLHPYTIENL